jgi:hypothetical protein
MLQLLKKLIRSKWFYSLVSFDTRCHSYIIFLSMNVMLNLIPKNIVVERFSGCKYKTLLFTYKEFFTIYFIFFYSPVLTGSLELSKGYIKCLNHMPKP